jgi:hypothetical protein
MTTLVERLRSLADAYPADVFPPVTDEDRANQPSLVTRASASMGRHFAPTFTEAADEIERLHAEPAAHAVGGEPVAWSRDGSIYDDTGVPIGTDETEIHWGIESPGEGWHPLYAAPLAAEGEEYPEAAKVCAEAYQVVGALLDDLGIFATEAGAKIMDNLSQHRLVHRDVLPWTTPPKPEQPEGEAP